ncbi:hypothetical protein CLIB1444_24S00672 [[Candida] jaroonii]|uniref:Uncharacterized protein n=1 Tax=[Candida] jaroonii TaxID=467808 RepID=A0ACA9YGL8_9ASCO|nr:hypothetical protein CLIB1444_24S00672 [[Candida] jaroonii]
MDQPRLSQLLNNTYIPPTKKSEAKVVPPYHPCLIVQDKHSELKMKPCGCADAYCVTNVDWIPKPK